MRRYDAASGNDVSLRCLSLFHSQRLSLRVEAMRRQLAALGVAASWRLGRWDLLERYLPAAEAAGPELLDGGDRWEVRLGRLLSAVSKGKTAAFQVQVRHVSSCSHADVVAPEPACIISGCWAAQLWSICLLYRAYATGVCFLPGAVLVGTASLALIDSTASNELAQFR